MSGSDSETPKRTTRPRRPRTTKAADVETAGLRDEQPRPVIEDVFDEVGHHRDADDFGTAEEKPKPKRATRTRRAKTTDEAAAADAPPASEPAPAAAASESAPEPAPRRKPRTATTRRGYRTATEHADYEPVTPAHEAYFTPDEPAPPRSPSREDVSERPEPPRAAAPVQERRDDDRPASFEAPARPPYTEQRGYTDQRDDASPDFGAGLDLDGPSAPPNGEERPQEGDQFGGQNRRRRRRRGRGGAGTGEAPAGPPHQNFQNNRPAQFRNQQGDRNFGQQGNQNRRGNNQNRHNNQNRGNQPRGQHQHGGQGFNQPYNNPNQAYNNQGPRTPEVVEEGSGLLELHPKGYGFLRDAKVGYMPQESDPFVSAALIEKHGLREGVLVQGEILTGGGRNQGPRVKTVQYLDGRTPEDFQQIKAFEDLTPINPFEQIKLETGTSPVTMRVMDLLTPIGKGQRALIVAPPRSGKTMLLQEIADAVSKNHPEVYLIVLLIDERPEEVTEMKRRVKGDVIASSMDREVENHVRVSQLIFERAKRMAESGRDVFILLDSITRTARAFNKWTGNTGRTMTGGIDIKAMDIPKKMFGTARRFEEGGSLTVVGTALIETGSKMDDIIFQEFKGTGNMEMVLSRDLADRRIWPAIDITRSGTRREEKILPPDALEGITMLRRSLISLNPTEAMDQLIRTLGKYKTNEEFLAKIRQIL